MSSSQSRRLAFQVNIGLTEMEAMALDRAARASNTSRAAFARGHVLAGVEVPETTRARRYSSMTSADLEAMAALISSLGRTTGSTVQLSKALRERGAVDQHRNVEQVLAGLRQRAREAAALIERLVDKR